MVAAPAMVAGSGARQNLARAGWVGRSGERRARALHLLSSESTLESEGQKFGENPAPGTVLVRCRPAPHASSSLRLGAGSCMCMCMYLVYDSGAPAGVSCVCDSLACAPSSDHRPSNSFSRSSSSEETAGRRARGRASSTRAVAGGPGLCCVVGGAVAAARARMGGAASSSSGAAALPRGAEAAGSSVQWLQRQLRLWDAGSRAQRLRMLEQVRAAQRCASARARWQRHCVRRKQPEAARLSPAVPWAWPPRLEPPEASLGAGGM